jgi:predicted RNase H-like nuclease (RuvC/YqgF family)
MWGKKKEIIKPTSAIDAIKFSEAMVSYRNSNIKLVNENNELKNTIEEQKRIINTYIDKIEQLKKTLKGVLE